MDDISLFLGFFSVIFAVFSCEMGVKIFYMPLFKPKKGGLELGRGTSKSNRIVCALFVCPLFCFRRAICFSLMHGETHPS